MKLKRADVSEIMHLKKIGYYLGVVSLNFDPEGEPVSHNISVKVRIKDTGFANFAEIEASILQKAVSVLSQATTALDGENPDTLHKLISDQEALESAERDRAFQNRLKNMDFTEPG